MYALAADPVAGIGESAEARAHLRVDPDRAALDRAARAFAKSEGIDYVSAVEQIAMAQDGLALAAQTGKADVAWNDTWTLPHGEVDPFNEQHKVRDQRRAEVAGVDYNDDARKAHALLGRDYVGEQAEAQRHAAVAENRASREARLAAAKQRGEVSAIRARNQRALERQQTRQQRAQRAREDAIHGADGGGYNDHNGVVPW